MSKTVTGVIDDATVDIDGGEIASDSYLSGTIENTGTINDGTITSEGIASGTVDSEGYISGGQIEGKTMTGTLASTVDVAGGKAVLGGTGTKDYTKLENLPTLNGDTIIGDMDEVDPTVGIISSERILEICQ